MGIWLNFVNIQGAVDKIFYEDVREMRGYIIHLALISYLTRENPIGCPYYLIKIISDETSFTKKLSLYFRGIA